MRLSTIVACLLVSSPSPALACIEHAAEQTGWLHESPSAFRHFAGAGAEESSMLGIWLFAAGSASLAMVLVGFRALSRAQERERTGPIEFEPCIPAEPSSAPVHPGEPRIRVDPGHEGPEPVGLGQGDEDGCVAPHGGSVAERSYPKAERRFRDSSLNTTTFSSDSTRLLPGRRLLPW